MVELILITVYVGMIVLCHSVGKKKREARQKEEQEFFDKWLTDAMSKKKMASTEEYPE